MRQKLCEEMYARARQVSTCNHAFVTTMQTIKMLESLRYFSRDMHARAGQVSTCDLAFVTTMQIVKRLEHQRLCKECMPGPGSSETAEQLVDFRC